MNTSSHNTTTMKLSTLNIQDKRKHRTVSTFLKKTYQLLNNTENISSIRWAPSGIGFIILNQDLFSKTVLPKYFKHSNYSSFVRQLNMYNFHKIRENTHQSYFHHQHFNIDNKDALAQIKRKPEKKKKKNNESDQENSQPESVSKIKKAHKIVKPIITQTKITILCNKEVLNSYKKVESQKNTQGPFQEERNYSIVRQPRSESSDQLSMEVEQDQQKSERHLPGVPTKQLINASKNNILPLTMSVQNVHTSIMSIFY